MVSIFKSNLNVINLFLCLFQLYIIKTTLSYRHIKGKSSFNKWSLYTAIKPSVNINTATTSPTEVINSNTKSNLQTPSSSSTSSQLQQQQPFISSLKNVKYRINELIPISEIESIRLRYILVATEETALSCRQMITSGLIDFQDLAPTISLCNTTKMNGGDTGEIYLSQFLNTMTKTVTINTNDDLNNINKKNNDIIPSSSFPPIPDANDNNNMDLTDDSAFYQSLLDATKSASIGNNDGDNIGMKMYNNYLPAELVNAACYMNKGDLKIIEVSSSSFSSSSSTSSSSNSNHNNNVDSSSTSSASNNNNNNKWYYLVQLLDVQTAISPILKQRRKQNYQQLLSTYQPSPTTSITNSSSSLSSSSENDDVDIHDEMVDTNPKSLNTQPLTLLNPKRQSILASTSTSPSFASSITTIPTTTRNNQNGNQLLPQQPSLLPQQQQQQIYNYFIETMGCQMNSADSERIEGQLQQLGYKKCEDIFKSNLIILNTCSIRDHAEHKVYSHLGPHAARKRRGENIILVIAGCVAQQEGEEVLKRFPEVDIVMGPQYANKMEELLLSVHDGNQVVATNPSYQSEDKIQPFRKSDISGWINVIYGCNERCTYCVVPYTRGVEQSRTKEAIVDEITELVHLGYKEVVLLGQNIDSWGRDMNPKQKFADLLRAVAAVPNLGRVRFLTSHPKYMSERVVQAVADNPNIGPSFYVPFQSGDNTVLKNMRRGYTRERYLEIIATIRKYLPDASLTADCIVGFPGETEDQFQNTLDLMEEVRFDMMRTAAYSPRPNTDAGIWPDQIDDVIKQERLQRINKLGNDHAMERSKRFINRIENILVEDINIKNPKQVIGRNTHGRICYFEGNFNELKGQFVNVLITDAKLYSLYGKMI